MMAPSNTPYRRGTSGGNRARQSNRSSDFIGFAPRAELSSTIVILTGLFLTGATLHGDSPTHLARYAAYGVGGSLALATYVDIRSGGLRNLIRADLIAMFALYFLTLFEFFFQQDTFDFMISTESTAVGVIACLWGFAGLAVGRHLSNLRKHPFAELFYRPIPNRWLMALMAGCFLMGFLNMLITVSFNPAKLVYYFMQPRFSQPWGRGQLGDWRALLHEFEMLLYLIPPIAGIVLARHRNFKASQKLFAFGCFFFVLFYGFSGGTRNVLASYLITFLISYSFAVGSKRRLAMIVLTCICIAVLLVSTVLMLEFRQVGLSNYITGRYENITPTTREQGLFIDYNLYAICRITEVFPKSHAYLGAEIPLLAVVRPIPRAIWKGKPEGLTVSLEETLGVEGLTVSASFIGEAYMSGGILMVFLTGLFFGYLTGWWGHFASPRNSDLGILIYASGFFATVISMRSLFVFTTAILPTVVGFTFGSWLLRRLRERRIGTDWQKARDADAQGPL